ncbi:MAG: hypothetical protein HN973_00805 [Lentimicrobiaceae bacterium]|nr:hypothetical protein [Lentimicrobiaceae bacterium]
MKYKVIDDFLDDKYFDSLVTLFTDKSKKGNTKMSWHFQSSISNKGIIEDNLFYMTHMIYDRNEPKSSHYEKLFPLLNKLDSKCLIRIKANLYPSTESIHEHPLHFDYPYSHYGAIFSLNTCDGYTKLTDGTIIESVANRILLFDPSEEHCSTTTSNASARININFNYL